MRLWHDDDNDDGEMSMVVIFIISLNIWNNTDDVNRYEKWNKIRYDKAMYNQGYEKFRWAMEFGYWNILVFFAIIEIKGHV